MTQISYTWEEDQAIIYDRLGHGPRRALSSVNGPIRFEADFVQPMLSALSAIHDSTQSTYNSRVMSVELQVSDNVTAFLKQVTANLERLQWAICQRGTGGAILTANAAAAFEDFDPALDQWELPVLESVGYSLAVSYVWWFRTLRVPNYRALIKSIAALGSEATGIHRDAWRAVAQHLHEGVPPYARRRVLSTASGVSLRRRALVPRGGQPIDHRAHVEQQYYAYRELVRRIDDEFIGPIHLVKAWANRRLAELTDRVLILHGRDPLLP